MSAESEQSSIQVQGVLEVLKPGIKVGPLREAAFGEYRPLGFSRRC